MLRRDPFVPVKNQRTKKAKKPMKKSDAAIRSRQRNRSRVSAREMWRAAFDERNLSAGVLAGLRVAAVVALNNGTRDNHRFFVGRAPTNGGWAGRWNVARAWGVAPCRLKVGSRAEGLGDRQAATGSYLLSYPGGREWGRGNCIRT